MSDSIDFDEDVVDLDGDQTYNTNEATQPPVKKSRDTKRRSKIWLDFDEDETKKRQLDQKAACKHCGVKYLCHTHKYGNKNLKNHLLKCKAYLAKKGAGQTEIHFEHGEGGTTKMMAWKFDQKESREALAQMIAVDELPFSFVEGEGFRHYNKVNQPLFHVPCRGTITKDCFALYLQEKAKLRESIQRNTGRICLTTDSWTSIKKKSYMALTAHFIDNCWDMKKKVLNFCLLDGHRGVDIGKGVESCLNEWGIDNVLTLSVDNASANDSAIDFLKINFANNQKCLLKGKWMHIRCGAHVLNLVVQVGMKQVDQSIENIRCVIKWVKKSGARISFFNTCAENAKCESTKLLVYDVSTRWNSTYNMLEIAQAYEHAFSRYHLEDPSFGIYVRSKNLSFPTSEDWIKARKLCHFLKIFDDVTTRISGTKYVTSHTLVVELAKIRETLREQVHCDILREQPTDQKLYDIAKVMKPKFDKYFGEIQNVNLLLYFAFLLDPRNKEEFLDIILDDHYGMEGKAIVELKKTHIKNEFKALYEDYVRIHAPSSTGTTSSTSGNRLHPSISTTNHDYGDRLRNKMKTTQTCNSTISDLDRYLGESVEAFDTNVRFEILTWWKVNSPRFPILSLVAKDLLAIPISTVASESVFSTSGRVLDLYRSSLGDKTVESLICTQDWLRKGKIADKEENEETTAQLENDLREQEVGRV